MSLSETCPIRGAQRLTTRWSGPGMPRQKQQMKAIRVQLRACEMAIPGRSARSRYAAYSIGQAHRMISQ